MTIWTSRYLTLKKLVFFDVELPEFKNLEEIMDELAAFDVDLPDLKDFESMLDRLAEDDIE